MGVRRNIAKTKSEPLTEQSIQQRLKHFFASWKYNVDGLYVFQWESDKLIWTKSGYIYEFEIKISRSDFKNDFKHKKEKHIILQGESEGNLFMPSAYESFERNKNLYVSFEDYVDQPEEVPEYAGLIWILKEYSYIRQSYAIMKQAPQLHKQKYKDAELNLGEKFYYNWQSDRHLRKEAQKATDYVRKLLEEELQSKGQEKTYHQMEVSLKMVEEDRDFYRKMYSEKCRDQNIDRMINHRLRARLKELDPSFDYQALERECEKYYGL